jgi:hypothetical protein
VRGSLQGSCIRFIITHLRSTMWEIGVLLALIVALLIIISYTGQGNMTLEPFSAYLSECPTGFKTFYAPNGDVMCCPGDVVGQQCLSDQVCTLGAETSTIPRCMDAVKQAQEEKMKSTCPPSMKAYFEDKVKKSGCTDGPLLDNMTGPRQSSQPTCYVYATKKENDNSANSCSNIKEMEEYPCFGTDCKKALRGNGDIPQLVEVSFRDPAGILRTSYTRASVMRELVARAARRGKQMGDGEKEMLKKSTIISEVAKAYFVDKTLQDSEVSLR